MRGEKRNSHLLVSIIAIVVLYIGLSAAFYYDLINAFVVVGALFLVFIISWILLFLHRHEKAKSSKISLVVVLVGLLIFFDIFLLQYEQLTYRALVHEEPVQAADNSGIHLMSVGMGYYSHFENKELLIKNFEKGDQEFFQIDEVDNKTRYHSRNERLLQFLGIQNDEVSVMRDNVRGYLQKETAGVEKFLASEENSGDSAGLGLALTGLIEQKKLSNDLEFAVTGAMNEHGEVGAIGMVKEKLMIAEGKNFPYMIIPSENAEEAEAVKKENNLGIEVFAVSHIDEAVELINRMNEEQGE